MAQHRHRQQKVKREHTIIEGLLPILLKAGELDEVTSITPGRISPRARSGETGLFFQYKTETGLKLIGRSKTAVQEVFVVTPDPDAALRALVERGLVQAASERPGGTAKGRGDEAGGGGSEPERPPADQRSSGRRPSRRRSPGKPHAKARTAPQTPAEPLPQPPAPAASGEPPAGEKPSPAAPPSPESEKVEPKLWNELLRLHHELLALERALGVTPPALDLPGETPARSRGND